MTTPDCTEMELLVQADCDGELGASDAARVAAHVRDCGRCAALQAELRDLSAQLRRELPRQVAPPPLHESLQRRFASRERRVRTNAARHNAARQGAYFATGFALAACLAILVVLPQRGPATMEPGMPEAAVSAHIRALQPGHLLDVVSTDQHTVKPWFDGRLPFAPPVKDFAAEGFPLIGGRMDYFAGHSAASVIYRRDKHIIDVFVWPGAVMAASGARNGYNWQTWQQGGMILTAVSDLNARDLRALTEKIRDAH